LLIEDNPDDVVFLGELLNHSPGFPHTLLTANSLAAGQVRLAEGGIDLLLLDLSLPDSHGLTTLESALKHSPGVPILIMTGYDEVEAGEEAVRKGAQDYLVKGKLNEELLTRTIRHALQRHQAQQELLRRENDIRLLTDQLPAVLWTTDRDLKITSSLGAGLTRLNLLPGQVVGMTIAEYFEVQQENEAVLQAHLSALLGRSVSFETRVRGRTQQAHVEPWRPGGGPVAGVIGVALDVTERRQIEEEMLIARHIQQSLLPNKAPVIPGWDIAGIAKPAETCSGDFFDFIPLPEGQLAAIVGDVSGHGFGPAILTASAHSYLHALTRTEKNLDMVLSITNELLIDDSPPEQYLTMFLMRLDPAENTLEYVGAGHPSGYLLNAQGELKKELKSHCSPLGWFRTSAYHLSEQIPIEPGDMFFMQSDGIPEAMSKQKEFFGDERVLECLKQHRNEPAKAILQRILEEVRAFVAPGKQRDDITAIVIKRLPVG
jgi:CheY-like chemotaxis protein